MNANEGRVPNIETQVKNPELVQRRRREIVDAAVPLFIDKGFHKTTTREIAAATGFSIGLLYEYVRSKEDVLYLVCEAIHGEVERGVDEALKGHTRGRDALAGMIRAYFEVCHRMNDHILLIYQETQSLPPHWRKRVLENEVRLTGLFVNALARIGGHGDLPRLTEKSIELMAHNITVLGHMWTFRRWFLARHYSIEDYISLQTDFITGLLGDLA